MLNIGIDAHILGKKKGGVEVYLFNLLKQLQHVNAGHAYQIYLNPHYARETIANGHPHVSFKNLPLSSPWLRRSISIPFAAYADKLDLLHVQRVIAPGFPHKKTVVSIYDIAQEIHPEFFDVSDHFLMRELIKWSARRAAMVITCSHASKEDMVRHFRLPPEKIVVAYPGFSSENAEENHCAGELIHETLEKMHVRTPYVIFVGALEPRKNILGLVEIARLLKESNQFDGSFVVVGGERAGVKPAYYEQIKQAVKDKNVGGRMVFAGYQPENVKKMLVKNAAALIHPSFYEGFGVPILEAMTAGVPVVASRIPVFTEIAGDAALFGNPHDPQEFSAQILKLLRSDADRIELIRRGQERASEFSWTETARKHHEVYNSVLQ